MTRRKNSYITLTDQFCGAGGSSIGATLAGAEVRLAMNHWKLAIETHNTNFPHVDHDCTDISAVDPRRYPTTDILITSPECTNHSVAKGKPRSYYTSDLFGKLLLDPSEERSRATMWDVPRFAEYHDYNMILVENVVDAARWRLWDSWLSAMHSLGYEHQVVYFNSMFAFPTPQSRDRLYTVFWKNGNRKPDLEFKPASWCPDCQMDVESLQTWKKRSHWGRYKSQYYYRCPRCTREVHPYYFAALNAIDFSVPAVRIADRKVALRPKTLERIQYGLDAYGRQALIVTGRYTSGVECRVRDASRSPLPTQPGDASHAVVLPWMIETAHSESGGKHGKSSHEPLFTQTTAQSVGFITKNYGGAANPLYMSSSLDAPLGTLTTSGNQSFSFTKPSPRGGLVTGKVIGKKDRDAVFHIAPAGSNVPKERGAALVAGTAFLTYYYGTHQASGMADGLHTVTGLDRAGLVSSKDDKPKIEDLYFRMLRPHEIGSAMAFPQTYVVLGTQREMVKQYGNAVTPPVMQMLIERCMETFK